MNKNRRGTPLQPYCKERQERLEKISLKLFRELLRRPNMTVEEMREMNNRGKENNTIEVRFLKRKE